MNIICQQKFIVKRYENVEKQYIDMLDKVYKIPLIVVEKLNKKKTSFISSFFY